jgi:hypothetical protein
MRFEKEKKKERWRERSILREAAVLDSELLVTGPEFIFIRKCRYSICCAFHLKSSPVIMSLEYCRHL